MVLTTIYLTRHGFRLNWSVDPKSGTYSSIHASPTNIPSDPPLAAHGADQSQELATYLSSLSGPRISRVYSSPFYRCLQTLEPYILGQAEGSRSVKGDNGLGEWYGHARFTHPSPATPKLLNELFPFYDLHYKPTIIPSTQGETIEELHDRCAYAMQSIIDAEDAAERGSIDKDQERAILICSHAASMIAIGRALTGQVPTDLSVDDFQTYTCGVSKFIRRSEKSKFGLGSEADTSEPVKKWWPGAGIPKFDWRSGKGVGGGWDCVVNSTCAHLSGGEERGWSFAEAETFV